MTTTAEGYAQPPFGPNNPMPRGYAPPGYEMGPLDNLMTIEAYNALSQTPRRQPAPQFSGGQNNAATGSSMALPQQQLPPTPSNPPILPPQIGQQKFGNSGIGSLGGGGGGQGNVSLNLQGSATVNPQGANQNRGYTGFDFNPGASGQMRLAEGGAIPAPAQQSRGIAALGRGKDTMLVHMTPGEVHGLQQLAMAHGGSLTINPQTGLPEAGFLSALLPMAAGFALGPAGFGVMSSLAAAGTVGGLAALASGSLKKGLMAGLGAYGGASLGGGLEAAGAQQAEALKAADLSKAMVEATPTSGSAAADLAFKQAQSVNSAANIEELVKQAAANPDAAMTSDAYRDFLTNQTPSTVEPTSNQIVEAQRDRMLDAIKNAPMGQATQDALARSPFQNSMQGIRELTGRGTGTASDAFKGFIGNAANEKTGVAASGLGGYPGAAKTLGTAAAPLLSSAMEPGKFNPPANRPAQFFNTSYNAPQYDPATGTYKPAFYGPGAYSTAYGVEGGAVGYARGGAIPDFYPLTGDARGPGEKPQYSSDIYGDDSGAGINDNKAGRGAYSDAAGKGVYENTPSGVEELFAKTNPTTLARYKTAKNAAKQAAAIKELRKRASAVNDYGDDTTSAAQGGLMGTYAAGGKLLRGDGDGMSDSIPAVIQGANPQRAALADGEFVIPADVVSHLGNGSTEAGSKRLYSMMDKVRRARTGNPKQGKQINPDRFMPA